MGRQNRKPIARDPFVCTRCKAGECESCVDVLRVIISLDEICNCKIPNHSGEPVDNQVVDPFTETVHGPGLSVTKDGEVNRE